jgi:pimeloyl-ACP methyl ester carboxylesterase
VKKGVAVTAYRTINVNGADVFYRESGEDAATTLLLLHGYPSSSVQYQSLMDDLEDRFHLIATELHLLDHFATATHHDEIAALIAAFLAEHTSRITSAVA